MNWKCLLRSWAWTADINRDSPDWIFSADFPFPEVMTVRKLISAAESVAFFTWGIKRLQGKLANVTLGERLRNVAAAHFAEFAATTRNHPKYQARIPWVLDELKSVCLTMHIWIKKYSTERTIDKENSLNWECLRVKGWDQSVGDILSPIIKNICTPFQLYRLPICLRREQGALASVITHCWDGALIKDKGDRMRSRQKDRVINIDCHGSSALNRRHFATSIFNFFALPSPSFPLSLPSRFPTSPFSPRST